MNILGKNITFINNSMFKLIESRKVGDMDKYEIVKHKKSKLHYSLFKQTIQSKDILY